MSLQKIGIVVNKGTTLVEVKDVAEAYPYVCLQIGRQRYQTTIQKGDCPEWNEGFVFDYPDDVGWLLRLDVINDDKIKHINFVSIGSTVLDLNSIANSLPKKIVVDTTFGQLYITVVDADKVLTLGKSKSISNVYDKPFSETAQKMSLPMTYPYENVWKRDGIKFIYNIDNINNKQDEMATRAIRNNWRYSQANMRFRTIAAREAGLTAEDILAERNKTKLTAISGDKKSSDLIDNYNIYAPSYQNIPDPVSNKAFYSTIINTNIQNQAYNSSQTQPQGQGRPGSGTGTVRDATGRDITATGAFDANAETIHGSTLTVPLEQFPFPAAQPDSRLAVATSTSFSSTLVTRSLLNKDVNKTHVRDLATVSMIQPYEFCTIYHQDYENPASPPLFSRSLNPNPVPPLTALQSQKLDFQSPEILIMKNNNRAKRRTDQVYNASEGIAAVTSHPVLNLVPPENADEDAAITTHRAPIQSALNRGVAFPTPNQLIKSQLHLAANPPPPVDEKDATSITRNNIPTSYPFPNPGAARVAPTLNTEYIKSYNDPSFVPSSVPTLSTTRGLGSTPPHDYGSTHFVRQPRYTPDAPVFEAKSYFSPSQKYSRTQPTQDAAFRTSTLSYPVPLLSEEQAREYVHATNPTATVDPTLISSTRGLISTSLDKASTLDAPPLETIPAQYKYSNSLRLEDDHNLYGMTHAAHKVKSNKYPVLGRRRYEMQHPVEAAQEEK